MRVAKCLICERLRPGMGRNQNRTFVNVAVGKRELGRSTETLAQFQLREPNAVWFDPAFNEFAIEISPDFFRDVGVEAGAVFPLFHDGRFNQPIWQQQNTTTGDILALGSYANPEDDVSAFTLDDPLEDDRFLVRIYDDDPVANPSANLLEFEEFTADPTGTVKTAERFIRVFRADGTPLNTNAADQRTEVGSKLIDFDFGSAANPPLSAGVARFFVDIADSSPGVVGTFGSNHRYKIITPSGLDFYQWRKFSKVVPLDD